jgi:hypothetical protein
MQVDIEDMANDDASLSFFVDMWDLMKEVCCNSKEYHTYQCIGT